MFKLYTERQMEHEFDRRMCEINRLDRIERRICELDEKLYRLEDHMFKPLSSCEELKRANDG